MKDWLNELEAGQKVFWACGPRGTDVSMCVVSKLTEKQIVVLSGETEVRFWRKNGDAVSGDKWYRSQLRPLTDKAARMSWLHRLVRGRLKKIENAVGGMELDALESLYAALKSIPLGDVE